MHKSILSLLLCFLTFNYAAAQDDLLNQLDTIKSNKKQIEIAAFKGLQIGNMQSTKLPAKKELYILISHRFGDLTKGFNNFFGLDDATTKIGGIYGLTNWLAIGASRHTNVNKTYELTAKYKLFDQQVNGFPFAVVGYNTMDINSGLKKEQYPLLRFTNRLAFISQLLISRKFTDALSLEVTPIYVHKNLYEKLNERKDLFVLGMGGRYKFTNRLSMNVDYGARVHPHDQRTFRDPLTVGLDIDTGGHIFQLVFSNAQQMNAVEVFSNASGRWNGGGIYFGFNLYRVF